MPHCAASAGLAPAVFLPAPKLGSSAALPRKPGAGRGNPGLGAIACDYRNRSKQRYHAEPQPRSGKPSDIPPRA
jgi:hypothetical protein